MIDNTSALNTAMPLVDITRETASLVAHLAQQAVMPRRIVDGEMYSVLDADGAVQLIETPEHKQCRLERAADQPSQVCREVTVTDAQSLIAYLAAYTDTDGVGKEYFRSGMGSLEVWADLEVREITGILDGLHGWRQHTATLQLRHSSEWQDWVTADGEMLRQEDFALFIEDHLSTIAEPDGAILLDICQTLQAKTDVAFKSQAILANGQRQFRYEETVDAKAGEKGNLTIPTELTLMLRPFVGSDPEPVKARFRFALRDGRLTLGVRLVEPDLVVEKAFTAIEESVAAQVPVPVLHGSGK